MKSEVIDNIFSNYSLPTGIKYHSFIFYFSISNRIITTFEICRERIIVLEGKGETIQDYCFRIFKELEKQGFYISGFVRDDDDKLLLRIPWADAYQLRIEFDIETDYSKEEKDDGNTDNDTTILPDTLNKLWG